MLAAIVAILSGGLSACAVPAGEHGMTASHGAATLENEALHRGEPGALEAFSQSFRGAVPDTVSFAFDAATLDATAQRVLDQQAAWLKQHPELHMAIIGHTDLVGSERYNYGLGLRRARSVLDYLVARGVSRGRLIAIESRGETDPIITTTAPERRNRRAVTMVAGLATDAGGTGLDGVYARRIFNAYQAGEISVTEAQSSISP